MRCQDLTRPPPSNTMHDADITSLIMNNKANMVSVNLTLNTVGAKCEHNVRKVTKVYTEW